jgi:hypothetical protein
MSAVGRELLAGIVEALKEDPALAGELRSLLALPSLATKADPGLLFMRVPAYAARVSLSERTVWGLVARGLPTVGSGRARRVDVAGADVWLRSERETTHEAVERSARHSARRAAKAAR